MTVAATVGAAAMVCAASLVVSTGSVASAATVPGPALFATSTTCGIKTFDWSGSNSTVNGDIHSNDEMVFGGVNAVNGLGTFVDRVHDASKIVWSPDSNNPTQVAVRSTPITFEAESYRPWELSQLWSMVPVCEK